MLSKTTINMAERRGLLVINRIEDTDSVGYPLHIKADQVEVLDISDADSDAMVLYYSTGNGYRYLTSTVQDGDFPLVIANESQLRTMLPYIQTALA